jgi:hypothetical protein
VERHSTLGRRGRLPRMAAIVWDQLRSLPELRRSDIVYLRWHILDVARPIAARVFRKPLVLEINGTYEDLILAYPKTRHLRRALSALCTAQLRQADAIIGVTPGLMAWADDRTKGRVASTWLPNGAPSALGRLRTTAAEPPYVVFVGSSLVGRGLTRSWLPVGMKHGLMQCLSW